MRGLKIYQAPYEAGFWDEHPNPTVRRLFICTIFFIPASYGLSEVLFRHARDVSVPEAAAVFATGHVVCAADQNRIVPRQPCPRGL